MERYVVESLAGRQYSWFLFNETLILGGTSTPLFSASFGRCFNITGIEPYLNGQITASETSVLFDKDGAAHEDVHLKKTGPYFNIECIGKWFVFALYTTEHPVIYSMKGPYLGNIDMYEGYWAASSGSVSRKIIDLTMRVNQRTTNLDVELSGTAGPVINGSYDGTGLNEYANDVPFKIAFRVPTEFVSKFLGLGDYDRNFKRHISSLNGDA